jgi:hypothetical protein
MAYDLINHPIIAYYEQAITIFSFKAISNFWISIKTGVDLA